MNQTMPLNFNTNSTAAGGGAEGAPTDRYRTETNRSSMFKGEVSMNTGGRRSRDPKEDIIQQRMVTTLRLENMNLKVPEQWRMKEAAFFRAKEIRQQVMGS